MTDPAGTARLEVSDGVAVVTIENAEVHNALTPELAAELIEACERIDRDESVGAAVVQGANGSFCSGADTRRWSPDLNWAGDGFELLSTIYEAFRRVGQLQVPTVAAVRGAAVGAGLNLMLACDLRVIADDARLTAGFLKIGLHPGGGFFSLLSRLGSREATAGIGLFGQDVDGRQAVAHGLAWESLADEKVEPRAFDLARIAARDPLLTRRAVSTFRTELGPPAVSWETALEMERGIQAWSMNRRLRRSPEGPAT